MRNFESAYSAYTLTEPVQQIDYFTNIGSGGGYTSPEYSNSYTMTVYDAPPSLYQQSVEYGHSAPIFVQDYAGYNYSYTPTPTPYTPIYQPPFVDDTPYTPSYQQPYTPTPTPYTPIYQPPFVDDTPAAPIFSQMEQTYTPTPYTPTPTPYTPSYQPPLVYDIYTPTPYTPTPTPIYQPPFVDDVVSPVFGGGYTARMEEIYTPTPTPYTPSYQPPLVYDIYTPTPYTPTPTPIYQPPFVDDVAAPVFTPMEQTYSTSYTPTPVYSEPIELIRPTFVDDDAVALTPTFVDDVVTPTPRPSYIDNNLVFNQPTAAPVDALMEETTPTIYSDARNELPFIPNWNSLDCQQFDTQLGNLQSVIRETRFTPAVYAQIQQAIQDGEKVKASKCASAPILIINSTPPVETPVETPIIKKVPIPLIIEKDGDSIGGGTPSNTGGGTFVDDKASTATTTSTLAATKKLPTAPVSKNLKPYVWALGGIVAILVVSRVLSKKS